MTGISGYESWLRAQSLSQNTIHQRVRFADRRWHKWGTWEQTPDDLADFLDRYAGWTRATYYSHLGSVYEWLMDTGQRADTPMRKVRKRPAPRPRPRPLAASQLEVVMADPHPRTRAFMLLAMFAGLRSHEVAKLHGRDIDEHGIYIMGKGGQAATLPTHPLLWELAEDYPANGYWFPSNQRGRLHISASLVGLRVAEHFRACGISHGSIHRLRVSFGTELLRGGASVRVVQELLRHSSLATTEHYLGVTDAERREAIRRLAA